MSKTLDEIREEANNLVLALCEEMTFCRKLPNLDMRAGTDFWVDKDKVITGVSNLRNLDYYGGFEYVESEYRMVIGDYVIFSREHVRVDEACGDIGSEDEDESEDEEEDKEWASLRLNVGC